MVFGVVMFGVLFAAVCCLLFCLVFCSAPSVASCFVEFSVRSHLLQGVFCLAFCSAIPAKTCFVRLFVWTCVCGCRFVCVRCSVNGGRTVLNGCCVQQAVFGLNGRSCSANGVRGQACVTVTPSRLMLQKSDRNERAPTQGGFSINFGSHLGQATRALFFTIRLVYLNRKRS